MAPSVPGSGAMRASRADWVVLTFLAISLVTNVALAIGVLRLASRASSSVALRPEGRPATRSVLGFRLLDAHRTDGGREHLTFEPGGRPPLLCVFAPSCRWWARNLSNAKAVFAGAEHTHRVVALSLAPKVGVSAEDFPLHVSVLVQPSPAAYEPYGLGSTPTTLVMSPDGRVLKAWVGAFTDDIGKEVEAHFGVRPPPNPISRPLLGVVLPHEERYSFRTEQFPFRTSLRLFRCPTAHMIEKGLPSRWSADPRQPRHQKKRGVAC